MPGTVWFANVPRAEVTPDERAATRASQWQRQLIELFAGDHGPARDLIAAGKLELAGDNTYDLPSVPIWHRGPMVIVGDAAHAPSPTSGQGASMAAEDGIVLAKCLRDLPDVPRARRIRAATPPTGEAHRCRRGAQQRNQLRRTRRPGAAGPAAAAGVPVPGDREIKGVDLRPPPRLADTHQPRIEPGPQGGLIARRITGTNVASTKTANAVRPSRSPRSRSSRCATAPFAGRCSAIGSLLVMTAAKPRTATCRVVVFTRRSPTSSTARFPKTVNKR